MDNILNETPKLLMTVKDLAELLSMSERTIYNKLSDGTWPIRPIRIGQRLLRFRLGDVRDYINSR